MLTNFHQNDAKKKFFFAKFFSKWPTQAESFLPKFYRLILGLVGLIDVKGIDVAQSIWS
jgi:hypothetical protein